MILDTVLLVAGLAIILLGCGLFTNGIEWLGRKLELGETAVGSLLAVVGTALPETLVPIVAFLSGGSKNHVAANHEVGIGAIIGAPFMLSTLAFFVTGLSVVVCARLLRRRSMTMSTNATSLQRDLSFFLIAYALVLAAGLGPWRWLHLLLAAGLLVMYGYYVRQTLKASGEMTEELTALHFARRHEDPHVLPVLFQVLVGLVAILLGAKLFVKYVADISLLYHCSPLLLSLIITPIATELPEKMNSVLWIKDAKDTLALGNITGAMVFQSCFPTAVGLAFTEWHLDHHALGSGLIALFMAAITLAYVRKYRTVSPVLLLSGGLCYAFFLIYVFVL